MTDPIVRPARSPVTNGVATLHDIMITMRDGARLATDVYLPAKDGALLMDRSSHPQERKQPEQT